MRAALVVSSFLISAAALHAAPAGVRSVFLNGIDISSAKSQDLKNVDIHISETGDVFIIAPHYQVNEEDTYVPLSKYVQGLNQPEHKAPQKIGGDPTAAAVQRPADLPVTKAGEPLSPQAEKQMMPAPGMVPMPQPSGGPAGEPAAATPVLGIPKAGEPPPGLPDEDAAPADTPKPIEDKPLSG